jgi:hypothetical protein
MYGERDKFFIPLIFFLSLFEREGEGGQVQFRRCHKKYLKLNYIKKYLLLSS